MHLSVYLYGPHLHHAQISRATRMLFAFFFPFSYHAGIHQQKSLRETHEVNLPLPITKDSVGVLFQVWALLIKKDRAQLARGQRPAMGVTRDVENSPKEKRRGMGQLMHENGRQSRRGIIVFIKRAMTCFPYLLRVRHTKK